MFSEGNAGLDGPEAGGVGRAGERSQERAAHVAAQSVRAHVDGVLGHAAVHRRGDAGLAATGAQHLSGDGNGHVQGQVALIEEIPARAAARSWHRGCSARPGPDTVVAVSRWPR